METEIQPARSNMAGETFVCEEAKADCFLVIVDGNVEEFFNTRPEAEAFVAGCNKDKEND